MKTFLDGLKPGDLAAENRIADLKETAAFYGRIVRARRLTIGPAPAGFRTETG